MPAVLAPDLAALVLIDWQERLFAAMPPTLREAALGRAADLAWLAGELGMPVVATEQYPRGLGPTLEAVRRPDPLEKLDFSAVPVPGFLDRLAGRRQILLTGMETHVCVAQTSRDLLRAGYEVRFVADALLSRGKLDWRMGLERMRADGAVPMTAEAVLFELVGRAGGDLFKQVSRRVK